MISGTRQHTCPDLIRGMARAADHYRCELSIGLSSRPGPGKLWARDLDPPEPVVRYEREHPGELIRQKPSRESGVFALPPIEGPGIIPS